MHWLITQYDRYHIYNVEGKQTMGCLPYFLYYIDYLILNNPHTIIKNVIFFTPSPTPSPAQ